MPLPKYYTSLFNAVTMAIEEIDNQNYGNARKILIKAQREAENYYMEDDSFAEHEFDYLDDKL